MDRNFPENCHEALTRDRALLGREVRMESTVAMGDVYASKWPEIDGLALSGIDIDLALAPGSFADLAPMHLVATSSITHLASLLPDVARRDQSLASSAASASG